MTDNEIIQALGYCLDNDWKGHKCGSCKYHNNIDCMIKLKIATLDLINRQKAEIERLENLLACHRKATGNLEGTLLDLLNKTKAEAYKEFADRLTEKINDSDVVYSTNYDIVMNYIDNLVKEMTEE